MNLYDRLFNRIVLAPDAPAGADGGAAAPVAAPDGAAAPAADPAATLYGDAPKGDAPADKPADKPAEGEKPADKPAGKDITSKSPLDETDDEQPLGDEEKKGETKQEEKPADVTFKAEEIKMPDGIPVDKAALEAFSPTFNELKLTTEQGQKLVDKYIELQKQQNDAYEKTQVEWKRAATVDPEIGKGNWDETKVMARKAIETFGTPQLREILMVSGLSTHPEVLRFLRRAGASVSEDKPVNNEVAGGKTLDPVAILYPKG